MVFGTPQLERRPILEHGTSRTGRWLRERRARLALAVAAVEAVLVVFGVIPRLAALVIAAGLIAIYFAVGRKLPSYTARQASWVAAASQAFVALIPVLLIVLGTIALIVVGLIAVVALVILFGDRR